MNSKAFKKVSVPEILILSLFVSTACLPTLAGGGEQIENVYFDAPGDYRAAPVTILLRDLRLEAAVSESAEASVISDEFHRSDRTHIGVRVPKGTPKGSPEWMNSPLNTKEEALVQVHYMDDSRIVEAGYHYPLQPNQQRTPWMKLMAFGDTRWAESTFVLESVTDEAKGTRLLEVVALDSDRIYFAGVSDDEGQTLLSASYSITTDDDPAETLRERSIAGTPRQGGVAQR